MPNKFIFVNGVLKKNPDYKNTQGATETIKVPGSENALTVVSSTQDIEDATAAQKQATGQEMQIATATSASIEIMQEADYVKQFATKETLDGGELFEGLSNIFSKYEVPIGLINKLLALTEYQLNFIVDDSGSMGLPSDVDFREAGKEVKAKRDPYGRRMNEQEKMSRWEEAENRIHIMMDFLAFVPIQTITIHFLNRNQVVTLHHTGKNPDQFAKEAHEEVSRAFDLRPSGTTPLYEKLSNAFNQTQNKMMHYVFTDGLPDGGVENVKELVRHRKNPQFNALTFMSCTDKTHEAQWMKDIEAVAPFTAELDDYLSERDEVISAQGSAFPFSKGFWLLCHLVAAINPYDLDAMDEDTPFSKYTLDNLLGRKLTNEEYLHYFQNNPHAKEYNNRYQEFLTVEKMACDIIQSQPPVAVPTVQPVPPPVLPYYYSHPAPMPPKLAPPAQPVQQAPQGMNGGYYGTAPQVGPYSSMAQTMYARPSLPPMPGYYPAAHPGYMANPHGFFSGPVVPPVANGTPANQNTGYMSMGKR